MGAFPSLPAQVAELVPAKAGHVVAALGFLYYVEASRALAIVQRLLEELHLEGCAISRVALEETFQAEDGLALRAAEVFAGSARMQNA